MFITGDARSSADVKALTDAAAARWGRLDVMVNNAGGITAPAPIAQLADDAWANDLQWNLSSVFYGTKHAFAHMLAARQRLGDQHLVGGRQNRCGRHGRIRRREARRARADQERRREAGRMGVTVNAICPG